MWGKIELSCRHWHKVRAAEVDAALASTIKCDVCQDQSVATGRIRKAGKLYGSKADALEQMAKERDRRQAKANDPLHLTQTEQRVLVMLTQTSDPQEIQRTLFGRTRAAAERCDEMLRRLEERKLVSMTWSDGKPIWTPAPIGEWTRSKAQVVRSARAVR